METELLTVKESALYRRCSVRKLDRERAEVADQRMSGSTAGSTIAEVTSISS